MYLIYDLFTLLFLIFNLKLTRIEKKIKNNRFIDAY